MPLLFGDRHRDPLTSFRATATKHFAPTTRLLTSAEPVGAFAALVVRLIRTLAHGMTPAIAIPSPPAMDGYWDLRRAIDTQAERGCQAADHGPTRIAIDCCVPRGQECNRRRLEARARRADSEQFSTGFLRPFRESNQHAFGSRFAVDFVLRSETAICYLRLTFSCGQLLTSGHGGTPEDAVDNFWMGCSFLVDLTNATQ